MMTFSTVAQPSRRLQQALLKSLPEKRVTRLAVLNGKDIKFRMSGLPRLCARMYGLMSLQDGDIVEELDVDSVYTLGTGTAIHHQFQTSYLAKLGDVFQGWWRCTHCLETVKGEPMPAGSMLSHKWTTKPKAECPYCKRRVATKEVAEALGLSESTDFEAIELEFVNREYPITGHCDGILDWNFSADDPTDLVEGLELKSINPRGFAYVDPLEGGTAKVDHIVQCQGYLWGLEGTGIDQFRVMYVAKDFERPMAQTFAEHVVKRDAGLIGRIQAALRKSRDQLREMDTWKASGGAMTGVLPPLVERLHLCTKKSDPRTKYCPMRDQCFQKPATKAPAKAKAAKS